MLALSTMVPAVTGRIGSHHRKLNEVVVVDKPVPGQFIVVLNDDVEDPSNALNGVLNANDSADKIQHVFNNRGFKALLVSKVNDQVLRRILDDSVVKEVFEVRNLHCFSEQLCHSEKQLTSSSPLPFAMYRMPNARQLPPPRRVPHGVSTELTLVPAWTQPSTMSWMAVM